MSAPDQRKPLIAPASFTSRGLDKIVVMKPPHEMTRSEALEFAAWIVAIADLNDEFPAILEAVQNT